MCAELTPDIHVMCQVPATVNIYRAQCSLSDAGSCFIPNNSPCILLYFFIINREKKARNSRISNKKRVTKFKQNWS